MSDDFTTTHNYGLFKPTVDADVDVWGDHLNANADKLDQIIRDIAIGGGGGGGAFRLVTEFLPSGQPDGTTDNSTDIQTAIDSAAGVIDDRAAAPGAFALVFPHTDNPYIIGPSSGIYIPSNSHIIIEAGATLKLGPQTNAHMFLLCNFAHHVLIELYGTLDGNSSQQYFAPNYSDTFPPATDTPPTSISGGISNDAIWGGPTRNPVVQGGICSHVQITGNRNGLITNFQNGTIGFSGATNCEISGISMTNSAFHAGSVGISGWRNFPYDPAVGTPLTFTGTFVAATGIVTLTTNVPHCMVPGEEFITESITGTSGSYTAATGKLFITRPGTSGNTIVYAGTGGGVGMDGVITGGRITSWFYQQATIVSGTYIPATGVITVTTTAPHQLVYGQMISSNITGGTAAAIATGIFQLFDVTDGQGMPPVTGTKAATLRYRTTRTGTTTNIVSGTYDASSGVVTLTTDVPHGMSAGDVVTIGLTGSHFLSGITAEQVLIAGSGGTAIRYQGPPNITGLSAPIITGGSVTGGPTQSITGGTIGVSTKTWNSGFDNCFMDQIRDQGPCFYGGCVACYIRHCEITRQTGSGPAIYSDLNSGRCVDCEISDNYIHDNLGGGLSVATVGQPQSIPHVGTRIFGNYVTGNRGGAGFGSCDGLECTNNRFFNNRAQGLNTYGSVGEITVGPHADRITITGNTIRDPCVISTAMSGTAMVQVDHGTYDNATGAVILYTLIPNNLYTNAYFTLSNATPTAAAVLNGRWITTAQPAATELHLQAPAGLGTFSITGGQLVPNGFGIVVHYANYLYVADNFIGDYQSTKTMLAAIGGVWGTNGVCQGNYYGPRINTTGNFPADMSAGGRRSGNVDTITGFTDGTTLTQPFSNDPGESFPPLGVSVGYNRSGGRGENTFYMGAGNAGPGGFEFVKVIGLSVASGTYDPATANVVLTTRTAHGLAIGTRFNLSLVLGHGADNIVTNLNDIFWLNGNWIATAVTSGTTLSFILTMSVAGDPDRQPNIGLDITGITAGAINYSAMDSGLIDTSVGLGGSLLANDGLGNTRLSGALVHGAMQTATLAAGGTVTVNPNTSLVLVQNASSIATGSVVLPAPAGGSYQLGGSGLEIRFQNAVGALTMTAAAGASIAGPPTAVLSGGSSFRFVLTEPGNVWLPCIADISGTPPVGGPYLALSGGAVTGPTAFSGAVTFSGTTTASGALNYTAIGGSVVRAAQARAADMLYVADFGATAAAIQAAHDALPATGGVIVLAMNTVYVVATEIAITKPNVRIVGPSWGTILRRTIGMTGAVINITGAGCVIENLTVDGNATAYDGVGHSELRMISANGLIDNVQVLKGGGSIHVTLAGEGACIRNSTITGLALAPPTETNYGVWAVNGNSVKIINNTITGTGIDAIGFDGAGTIVSGNRVFNCHWYVANGGGQIACYSTGTGAIIANNSVGPGGATGAGGIEVDGDNIVISGNEVVGPQGNGITLTAHASHILVDGNLVKNTGSGGVVFIGISVAAGVSDFQIINNRVFDDQATKTMHWGVSIIGGAGDRFVVQGNVLAPTFTGALADAATGTDKIISDNIGVDDVIGSVASAATVTFPLNSIVSLTGTTGITAIAAAGSWRGRKLTLIPTGVLTIAVGATIANAITTTAGVPVQAVFDGTLWHFQTAFAGALTATSGLVTSYTGTLPTAVPLSLFDIVGSGASNLRQSMTAAGGTPSMIFRSAGGTMGVPTPTPNNQVMGGMAVAGYAPTAGWGTAGLGSIQFTAAGLWSDTSQPTFIQFLTTPIGSTTPSECMRVSPNGNLLIGGAVDGAIKLDVTGTSRFQGVGFNNTVPIAKPTVTGSKGANAALASLLTALAAYGLVTDSST